LAEDAGEADKDGKGESYDHFTACTCISTDSNFLQTFVRFEVGLQGYKSPHPLPHGLFTTSGFEFYKLLPFVSASISLHFSNSLKLLD
jgi:hypothetical protein